VILRTDGSDFGGIIVQVKYVQVKYIPDTGPPSLPMIIGHSPLLSMDANFYEVGGRQYLRSRPGKCGRQHGSCRAEGAAGRITGGDLPSDLRDRPASARCAGAHRSQAGDRPGREPRVHLPLPMSTGGCKTGTGTATQPRSRVLSTSTSSTRWPSWTARVTS